MFFELKPQDDPGRLPLGSIFSWRSKLWRRGRGRLYRARPADPTIQHAFMVREVKRQRARRWAEWKLRNR